MRDKSGDIPIAGVLKPQAIAAAGNAVGAVYADASKASWFVAFCSVGAGGGIGSGAFTIVQATDSSGSGTKAVTGPAGATLAVDGASASFDVDPQYLDIAGGFTFIAIKCVMTGGTNCVAQGVLVQTDPHYAV